MYSDKFKKFIDIWREEFAMERSIDEKVCRDKDGNPLPWYTFPAIEYLVQFDYSQVKVFEFGCGYSTAFWAQRAQKVVSIEDNPVWYEKWKKEFVFSNAEIRWRAEGESYENAILEDEDYFNVVIIDGKRRAACAETALKRLAPGGIVILDDSDRINISQEYTEAVKILRKAGLIQIDFYGFCPMNNYPKTTSLFLRRDYDPVSLYKVQPVNGRGNLWSKARKERKDFYKQNK